MNFRRFDPKYLLRLEVCLKLLPNVKPKKARALLKLWQETINDQICQDAMEGVERDDYSIDLGNSIILSSEDFEHIFFGEEFSAKSITPHGASLLLDIYKQGLFEVKGNLDVQGIPCELIGYCSSTDEIVAKQEAIKNIQLQKNSEYKESLTDLNKYKESQFSYQLLNDIFVSKFGYKGGHHSLCIDGVSVSKLVSHHTSNSGKSSDWQVSFSWVSKDGQHKIIKKRVYMLIIAEMMLIVIMVCTNSK
ncbi:hypothetical protein [Vibrio algarum]|uniref:DUF2913 family protein n=1 Tax=Vibrio algarum TaxID=3020714 RepID=A0ABT4YS98_9VIBR|nr:hypothetical protein [Vibrio sp. KJ40-1]MDB1124260.1 hypothetical protein [Vibrio sp. KJ40-1]